MFEAREEYREVLAVDGEEDGELGTKEGREGDAKRDPVGGGVDACSGSVSLSIARVVQNTTHLLRPRTRL